ncbi:helix-turn-helix domain-containing protein [Epilithonimonas sp.]|uniref:helix-turn-helix domain-containing protein n=1 Tax=Epilithonimonas sp. TaxID=2894511 RepID=UPI00289E71F2|nr:helix-turn-helix domain-containing protein [Epilithonimonas sp.]
MKKIISDVLSNIKQVVREVIREESTRFAKWFKDMLADEDKYLSRNETAEYLGMSLSTLGRHTKSGLIKAHGIGDRVFYKLSDIHSAMKPIN